MLTTRENEWLLKISLHSPKWATATGERRIRYFTEEDSILVLLCSAIWRNVNLELIIGHLMEESCFLDTWAQEACKLEEGNLWFWWLKVSYGSVLSVVTGTFLTWLRLHVTHAWLWLFTLFPTPWNSKKSLRNQSVVTLLSSLLRDHNVLQKLLWVPCQTSNHFLMLFSFYIFFHHQLFVECPLYFKQLLTLLSLGIFL